MVVAVYRGPGKPSARLWREQVGQALPESVTCAALSASHRDFGCRWRGGGGGRLRSLDVTSFPSCPADVEPLCGGDHGQF